MKQQQIITSELQARCIAGDNQAFQQLYQLCAKGIFNAIYRIVTNREEAEDLLQETFMTAFEKMQNYRGDATLYGWIKKIGINKSLNALKKRKIEFSNDDNIQLIEEQEDNAWNELNLDASQILQKMDLLSDGFKIVLTLFLFEDYSHQEIASELGISESTSKTQYLRGKKKLRELLIEN